jgi:hypothetical protein
MRCCRRRSRGRCAGDDDLAIEHAALGQRLVQRLLQLGEVAVQRPQVAALQVGLLAAEHERAEAVPLGLEQEALRPRAARPRRSWPAWASIGAFRAKAGCRRAGPMGSVPDWVMLVVGMRCHGSGPSENSFEVRKRRLHAFAASGDASCRRGGACAVGAAPRIGARPRLHGGQRGVAVQDKRATCMRGREMPRRCGIVPLAATLCGRHALCPRGKEQPHHDQDRHRRRPRGRAFRPQGFLLHLRGFPGGRRGRHRPRGDRHGPHHGDGRAGDGPVHARAKAASMRWPWCAPRRRNWACSS